jgi:hypothetical protein
MIFVIVEEGVHLIKLTGVHQLALAIKLFCRLQCILMIVTIKDVFTSITNRAVILYTLPNKACVMRGESIMG